MSDPRRWVRRVCRYGIPVFLGALAVAAGWDSAHRWPVAAQALTAFPDQQAVLVGFGAFSGSTTQRRASYQLLPSRTAAPRVVTVSQAPDGSIRVEVGPAGRLRFALSAAVALLLVAVCVKSWIQPDGGPPGSA